MGLESGSVNANKPLWLIYISGDGLRYGIELGFLSCTEIGNRDPSQSLCNMNMFCGVQRRSVGLHQCK